MDYKLMEEKLENLGFKIIDVKDRFIYHSYHIYAVYKNGYALSICQGIRYNGSFGRGCYNNDYTFEVALGRYENNEFYLVYKGKWKEDVLGWQSFDDVIKLAKSVKRFKS